MRRRVLLATLLLAALSFGTVAQAHHSTRSRVHNIREIVLAHIGDVARTCDHGTMDMPIMRVPGLTARTDHVAEFAHNHDVDGLDPPYTGCEILLDDRPWDTEYLCTVLGHEFTHATGWRAPPGQEYILPDGTPDYHHSRDPTSLMWPYKLLPWPPCENGAADTFRHRPPKPRPRRPAPRVVGRAVTVLLLPGGGWQNADPATMRAWQQDFVAHGVQADIIGYPTGSVTRGIDYVAGVAAALRARGPVVAYGISAGGTIAAALAATGQVDGAVNVAGPTDFTRWVTPSGLYIMAQLHMGAAERRAASPYWRLNGRQAPQLIQCGLLDPLVTYDQCVRYARAAWAGQPDTTLQPMANAHAQWATPDRVRARAWVLSHWPVGSP